MTTRLAFANWLQLAYFGLMGLGLLLASFFLCVGKLDGSEWVTVCSVLFGADRLAASVSQRVPPP